MINLYAVGVYLPEGRHPNIPLFHYSIIPVVSEANQVPKGGITMDNNELFKNVLQWAYHHCPDLWKEYSVQSSPEKKQHVARKILIEKVKKEPDTELLISPALKKKILLNEGVDLKRINEEPQEKKESCKDQQETKLSNQEQITDSDIDKEKQEKIINNQEQSADSDIDEDQQETKISNQEQSADSDIDEDEIANVNLYDQLTREWNKFKWYSIPAIAKKLGRHRNSVVYWRDFGIKVNGSNIRLKMAKRPFKWYSKGKWIIEFFLKTNDNVDME
jgi:hypothetical protein